MTIANFFWHGSELSLYEEICLKSFVKKNFIVNLYSYQKFKKINGVNNIDANEIINEDFLNKYTHDNKKGCLAAFSDEFRILLMKFNKGWWFDIDIICLRDARDFDELDNNKNIVAGYEDSNKNISNGILKINNQEIVSSILSEIKRYGNKFSWGMIGPNLLKRIVKKYSFLEKEIVPETKVIEEQLVKKVEVKKKDPFVFKTAEPYRKDYSRLVYWCNPHEPINKGKLGSSQSWRKKETFKGYY
jgi:hypothetical protein